MHAQRPQPKSINPCKASTDTPTSGPHPSPYQGVRVLYEAVFLQNTQDSQPQLLEVTELQQRRQVLEEYLSGGSEEGDDGEGEEGEEEGVRKGRRGRLAWMGE